MGVPVRDSRRKEGSRITRLILGPLGQARHLEDDMLLPEYSACCFCGSERRDVVAKLQDAPEVLLLKCADCHAASASRIPSSEALVNYYRDFFEFAYSAAPEARVTFAGTRRFGRHIARRVAKHVNGSSMRVLDFGGGDGENSVGVVRQLLRKGVTDAEVTVVDHNRTLATTGDTRIVMVHRDSLDDLPSSRFDLVLASAVLEHLPQPKETLGRLLDALEVGGLFYARTPYCVPIIRLLRVLGVQWDFAFPSHIHDLGQDFWAVLFDRVFRTTGFEVLESRPSIVETSIRDHFFTTVAASVLKVPWWLVGSRYGLVGGWEVFLRKNADSPLAVGE